MSQSYEPAHPIGLPPAMGRLAVHSSHPPMLFLFGSNNPEVAINGQPRTVPWGTAPFDLPAGNYHVWVITRHILDFGPAELLVTVYPGQVTNLYYRTPAFFGLAGSLGLTPQQTRGMRLILTGALA